MRFLAANLILAAALVLTSCGGGAKTPLTQPAVSNTSAQTIYVSISPASATVVEGQSRAFTATVLVSDSGAGLSTNVTWSLLEGATGGSISNSGMFTAGAVAGVCHVVATSVADPSKLIMAPVTVGGIAVSPQNDTLGPGGTRKFIANAPATWQVQEGPAGGSIASDGTYVAPGAAGTYHVVATNAVVASNSATATVMVLTSGFTFIGSLNNPRVQHTATLLSNGKVLVVGGAVGDFDNGFSAISQAELFDPSTKTFAAAGTDGRYSHTATLLANGKVLVAGGDTGPGPISTADLYDPATGTFQPTTSMSTAREAQTSTLLNDGRVLVTGGSTVVGTTWQITNTAEIYDPATGSFTATGNMAQARALHTATLLVNGKVLITGGDSLTAEVYDPVTGSFTAVGNMAAVRRAHTATLLGNGKVLVTGGQPNGAQTAELFDPIPRLCSMTEQS